jgi:hypothetical protein
VNNPTLANAFDALAAARLGRAFNDEKMLAFSVKSYGKALSAVHRDIRHPKGRWSNETLAAIMVMSLYEIHGGSTNGAFGWTSHVQASSSLLQLRRESGDMSTFDQQLYLGSKLDTVSRSIG